MSERPARERRRLLFLLPFVPRLDAPHGGGRVTAALLWELTKRHEVAIVCIRGARDQSVEPEIAARCKIVSEVEAPRRRRVGVWHNRLRQLRKVVGAPPNLVEVAHVEEAAERVRRVAEAFRPDIVQVELTEMAQYLKEIPAGKARTVLVDHDPPIAAATDFSAAAGGVKRRFRQLDVRAWRRYMRSVEDRIDAVVVFTDRDRAAVLRDTGRDATVIPLAVDVRHEPLDPVGADPPRILFFGGFRHPPNADAAMRMVSIFRELRARHPGALLELVGADPTTEMRGVAGDGIEITGWVESVTPYLDRASVVAAPLRQGGGTRVKILETLASGKALVATGRATEGIALEHNREYLHAERDDEFVAALDLLLADPGLRAALAGRARSWAEQNAGWEVVADAYDSLYARLLRES